MNNDYFVKIEDKTMPICDFDYPDLDIENKEIKNAGFVNFIYLFFGLEMKNIYLIY